MELNTCMKIRHKSSALLFLKKKFAASKNLSCFIVLYTS